MLLKNVVKCLEKMDASIKIDGEYLTAICKNSSIEFNPKIGAVYIKSLEDKDDVYTDYFPGIWVRRIKDIPLFIR